MLYEYSTVNCSNYPNLAEAANEAARRGWRTVGVIPSQGPGWATSLLVERELGPPVILKFPDPPKTKRRRWWNPRSW